jgi:hypothetical protein
MIETINTSYPNKTVFFLKAYVCIRLAFLSLYGWMIALVRGFTEEAGWPDLSWLRLL